MNHPRAQFSFSERIENVITIIDANRGQVSVTNDIENVVAFICTIRQLTPESKVWVYKDTDNHWAGFDPVTGKFYDIGIKPSCASLFSTIANSPQVKQRLKQLSNEM